VNPQSAGVGKHVTVHRGGINLPALTAHLVDAGIERATRAQHGFGGQRTAHTAEANRSSASNRPRSANAVDAWCRSAAPAPLSPPG
jgi:hypothetical protein